MRKKKKLNDYRKKLISKNKPSNFQIPLPLFLFALSGVSIFSARGVDSYELFNGLMLVGGILFLLGLMSLFKGK